MRSSLQLQTTFQLEAAWMLLRTVDNLARSQPESRFQQRSRILAVSRRRKMGMLLLPACCSFETGVAMASLSPVPVPRIIPRYDCARSRVSNLRRA